ncbi:MAG: zinc-dependent metalloprotease [Firmicutes bacterium]|nr:zinc-dependent metalloprotease [Bacillota bacterium]
MKVEPIAWDLAKSVAEKTISYSHAALPEAELESLQSEFNEIGKKAEKIVKKETGLKPSGKAVCQVVTRASWVEANISSLRNLMSLGQGKAKRSQLFGKALNPATSAAAGIELGLMLAWLSTKVLGQYDMAIGAAQAGDTVYFVAENILAVEDEYKFDKGQFRLWVAIHELTHRSQFRGVAWMNNYFEDLIKRSMSLATLTLDDLLAGLRRSIAALATGNNPLAEHGLVGLFVSGEHMDALRQAQALMSVVEGHSDVIMDRAAGENIKDAKLFSDTLHARRQAGSGPAKFIRQMTGMEAKAAQYKKGEEFIYHIESVGGQKVMDKIWDSPTALPTIEEIAQPDLWVNRVLGK